MDQRRRRIRLNTDPLRKDSMEIKRDGDMISIQMKIPTIMMASETTLIDDDDDGVIDLIDNFPQMDQK